MYRFDPRRYTIAVHGGNSPNPHGIAFDNWGYHYATDGTGGRPYQVRPEGKGWKMHSLLNKEVRPVPACEVLSSDNFPKDMQGDFLICNSIGFLGIKQYKLHRDGGYEKTKTVGRGKDAKKVVEKTKLGEVWGTPNGEKLKVTKTLANGDPQEEEADGFFLSGDKNFRPTDAIFGEDGALYVADWQNVIIGHMQHNVRDPNRDHKHGRIFRVSYTKKPLQKKVAIEGQPIEKLLENLKHSVDGVRHRTRVELSERDTDEVIATVAPEAPYDAAPDKGSVVSLRSGDACRQLGTGMVLNHIGSTPCGRYFYGDRVTRDTIAVGSPSTGKTVVIHEGPEEDPGGSPFGQHSHPHAYLTPDFRWMVFNSDQTGRPQIYACQIPVELLHGLDSD